MKLYIANKNYSSWSLRPWVLMKMLEIPFEEATVLFEADNFERFRAFAPNARVPALHDGETIVWDSLAIAEYLAESNSGVWPQDRIARAFARSAAAEMHSGFQTLRDICTMNCGVTVTLHEVTPALKKDIDRIAEIFTEGLERFGGPFLAGSAFTAVDAFFTPVAFRVRTYGLDLPEPAAAYVARLLELPAMREWDAAARAETTREIHHEDEIAAIGTVIADVRAT